MNDLFQQSLYAGVVLTVLSYFIGDFLHRKTKMEIVNPLLIAIAIIISVLVLFKIDYQVYNESTKYLTYLLTPATVSLAIPLYEQWALLKKHYKAIFGALFVGVLTSLCTILACSVLFRLSHTDYVTLLPKSITTAIAMGVSEELGGYVAITVTVIVITGVLGYMFGELICKAFRIKEPIAKGLAIGCASHAMGTAKAIEIGEVEGAMSGLAIAVSGVLTVLFASAFAGIY